MNNAVIYARYSSHSQNEQSIETQINTCMEYAKKNNLNVIKIYEDKAKSATNDNRESFQQMLDDSSSKKFKYLLLYNLSRFARNATESVLNEVILTKNGVSIISVNENIGGDDDDPLTGLMKNLMRGVNEYYSKNTAKNIRDGLKTNAKKGLSIGGQSLPLGYKSVKETREIIIDKEIEPVIKKIFEMYRDNNTYAEIIRYLNINGLKTSRGNEFNKNSIKRLLKNEKYIGKYRFRGEVVSSIPKVIDEELFYEVQDILEKRKQAPSRGRAKNEYLLTTKLFCGECEEMMTGFSGTSKTGKLYNYYACKNSKVKKCNKRKINKQLIEDYVVSKAKRLLDTIDLNEIAENVMESINNSKDASDVKRLTKELKSIENQKRNLFDSLKMCKSDSLKEDIFEELNKLEELRNEINNQLIYEEISSIRLSARDIVVFLKDLKKGRITDDLYRKMLVEVFINKIYLYDDSRIMFLFTTQSKPCEDKIPPLNCLESSFESQSAPP